MSFTALKRQPAERLAAEALKKSILAGDLKPGERLTEMVLADQFAVSRGTVRTALHQLNSDGLVVLTPYTGWSVTTIDRHDIWEIYTLRAGLETLATRLAAERLDEDGRSRLIEARDRFFAACERPDVAGAVEHDFELHRCIVALSGKPSSGIAVPVRRAADPPFHQFDLRHSAQHLDRGRPSRPDRRRDPGRPGALGGTVRRTAYPERGRSASCDR